MTLKNKKLTFILILTIIVVIVAFIWSNSIDVADVSSEKSGTVLNILKPILSLFIKEDLITDHLVRKLAHFSEFAVLGFFLTVFRSMFSIKKARIYSDSLVSGLLIALGDETIQLFSAGRSAQISDVWLDFSGVVFGFFIYLIFCLLFFKNKKMD